MTADRCCCALALKICDCGRAGVVFAFEAKVWGCAVDGCGVLAGALFALLAFEAAAVALAVLFVF
jgi:hypothetical protein